MRSEKAELVSLNRRDFLKLSLASAVVAKLSTIKEIEPQGTDSREFLNLNERVSEILSLVEPLSFDIQGNLVKETIDGSSERIETIPTKFSRHQEKQVESVDLLVVHYDGNDRYWDLGDYKVERHAESIVWLLDRNGFSVHWCVDGFPIGEKEEGVESGYGVLQTHKTSGDTSLPLVGAHVKMEVGDETKLETLEIFKSLGINSNLQSLYERRVGSFNFHTAGFEQVGTQFDLGFPSKNQADSQQLANALSLTVAVMRQFNLSAWDVVGHHEVQKFKFDPGDYYMATLRFLLGVAALQDKAPNDLVFSNYRGPKKEKRYFETIYQYLEQRKPYGYLWHWKDYVGYDDFMDSLNTWYFITDRLKFLR